LDLAHCGCANEEIRPSRMNPERGTQLTNPKKRARIAGRRAARPAVSLNKSGISSGAFKSKSYGELSFDFATLACSQRLAIWIGDVLTATLHNSYAVKADSDPFESASAVLVNARVIALSAVASRL
jgi:hypothetical protein